MKAKSSNPELVHIYIGNHPDPAQRLQLDITPEDYAKLPRGSRAQAVVTNVTTGKQYKLRRASCGLPHCLCALELVAEVSHAS